jgi:mono/diheme cytochrome c family protein
LAAILLAGSFSRLAAQDIGDIAVGRQLAETWCSTCHVVGPTRQSGASTGAPTFAAIARMKSTTPLSLRAFLQTPHSRMPDLNLSRDEIDDLAAYLLSLRRK